MNSNHHLQNEAAKKTTAEGKKKKANWSLLVGTSQHSELL